MTRCMTGNCCLHAKIEKLYPVIAQS